MLTDEKYNFSRVKRSGKIPSPSVRLLIKDLIEFFGGNLTVV
jgi:hypothetical protein